MRIGSLVLLLLAALALGAPARAAELVDDDLPRRGSGWEDDPWEVQYRRGMGTALAGRLLLGASPLLVLGGAFALVQGVNAGDAETTQVGMFLLIAGALAGWTGPPMVAAGSLRARRALRRAGRRVPATGGALAWALWAAAIGASYGLAITEQRGWSYATGIALVSSVAAGQVQVGDNRRAAETLGWSERRVELALVPRPGGLGLVGRF